VTRKHIVITGTGRSGTTFLVELLTHMGIETGFNGKDLEGLKDRISHGGLELDIRSEDAPYVVKSPWFCDYAAEVLNRDDIIVEHVFIPIRDLSAAAESRRLVSKEHSTDLPLLKRLKLKSTMKSRPAAGGLWYTASIRKGKQEEVLMNQIYKLLFALSESRVPVTLLHYPKLVKDSTYLYDKLKPVLGAISYDEFRKVYQETVRPDLVHSFNPNDTLPPSKGS